MKKLYKMELDCGRHGVIDSLFIATEDEVKELYNKEAYFYEVLGKHSEIIWKYEPEDFKVIEGIPPETCELLVKAVGRRVISGCSPWSYLREIEEE